MSQCVEVWRNFIHSYSLKYCCLLWCRTLEEQAIIQEPECTPSSPKPLHKHRYINICRQSNCAFYTADQKVSHNVCFAYRLHWISLLVEISALAYETNSSCYPEVLSVAYSTHIIQREIIFKNHTSTIIDVYSNWRAHTHASFSAGVMYSSHGVETYNTKPLI